MRKIGIMGGTFNPIHNAHLILAEQAYEQFGLDEICFIPSKRPAYKELSEVIDEDDRMAMVQLAISCNEHFTASDIEFKRKGNTYTKDTLALLKKNFPSDIFYFIIGADSLFDLEGWYCPEDVLSQAVILAAQRGSQDDSMVKRKMAELNAKYNADIRLLKVPNMDLSSKEIRKACASHKSIRYYVPERVDAYITEHELYGRENPGKITAANSFLSLISSLEEKMAALLNPKRFAHSQGVAYLASCLAMRYGQDEKKAMIAGLLHDNAKYIPFNEAIAECDKHNIILSDFEREHPFLIHGKLGAFYAKENYKIDDPEILSAITYHTTGRVNMSFLEKVIFLADYMEIHRSQKTDPPLSKLRTTAFDDLDKAVYLVLNNTINYLTKTNSPIDKTSLLAFDFYKKGVAHE